MTGYLQRLFDGAAAAGEAPLRPAQRGGSPLITVDQRLARPELAADMGFGATRPAGAAGEETAPLLWGPTALDMPRPALRRAGAAAAEMSSGEVPDVRPRPPTSWSPAGSREPAARPSEELASESDAAGATISAVSPPSFMASRTSAAPAPAQSAVVFPPAGVRRPAVAANALRAAGVPHVQPLQSAVLPDPEASRMRAPGAHPSPSLRPAAAAAPAPLPPVALPPSWSEIEERVRAIVRSERDRDAASATASAERPPAAAPRPMTAEAASVIGKLERPARHSTLFGARLR